MSAIMKAQASSIKPLAEAMSLGLADDKVRVAAAFAESAHRYDAVAGLQRQVGAKLMVKAAARLAGMRTMREDAIIKALRGEIAFVEVNTLGGELFPDAPED